MMISKNVTIKMPVDLMDEIKFFVKQGNFSSINAFFSAAAQQTLADMKREQIRLSMKEAAADPLFLSDCAEIERDFYFIDYPKEHFHDK